MSTFIRSPWTGRVTEQVTVAYQTPSGAVAHATMSRECAERFVAQLARRNRTAVIA